MALCCSGDNGPATSAQFEDIRGIAVDSAGNLYIADVIGSIASARSPMGMITTVAGNGTAVSAATTARPPTRK